MVMGQSEEGYLDKAVRALEGQNREFLMRGKGIRRVRSLN